MRRAPLPDAVSPALVFDPRPKNFSYRAEPIASAWHLPEVVDRPFNEVDLAFKTVAELSVLIQSRAISSTVLTKLYLDRLKKYGDTLQTVVTLTEALALKQAARADRELAEGHYRGPLHGIPYGIKDLFAVKGYKTTWGAEPYQNQTIDLNAEVVRLLDSAGAVLIA